MECDDHIDGIGGDAVIFHVEANKHVFACRHLNELAYVCHSLFPVDEKAEGRGFDAQVGIELMGFDGFHHANVFLEEELRFVHGRNFFSQNVDGEACTFVAQPLHHRNSIFEACACHVATADPTDKPLWHPNGGGNHQLREPTHHGQPTKEALFDPLCWSLCLPDSLFDLMRGEKRNTFGRKEFSDGLALPAFERLLSMEQTMSPPGNDTRVASKPAWMD